MAIKFEQAEFLFLKDVAEEILSSDTYHPSLRRTLPGTDGTKIWHTFHRNGTKAAILCAMLVALEKGEDPITAVSTVVRTDPKPDAPQHPVDTFTDAALQQQGDAPKPDFNSLKKPQGDARTFPGGEKVPPTHPDRPGFHGTEPMKEGETIVVAQDMGNMKEGSYTVRLGGTLNDDIGRQEEELIPPGKMQYKTPQPEPTPTPTEAPKNKGGRPKKTFPAKTAEETLDESLKENK